MSWKHFGKLRELTASAAKAYTQKNPLTVTLESKMMTFKCLHDLKTHLKMKKVVNFYTCRDLNN